MLNGVTLSGETDKVESVKWITSSPATDRVVSVKWVTLW